MYYDTRTNMPRSPRRLEVKLSDGALLGPPASGWTSELLALCGLVEIVSTSRPGDTAEGTHDRGVELVADVPTVVWTFRPWTAAEIADRQRNVNQQIIDAAIANALAELQQLVDAPDVPTVASETMTTAQLSNALRAMRDVVQQNRAGIRRLAATQRHTIRMIRGDFDGID